MLLDFKSYSRDQEPKEVAGAFVLALFLWISDGLLSLLIAEVLVLALIKT
jgi:hypothetical protein